MNEIKLLALALAIGIGTLLNADGDMSSSWDFDEELELEILQDQVSEDAEFLKDFLYKDTLNENDIKELEAFDAYLNENYKNYLELDMYAQVNSFITPLVHEIDECIAK